jgi:N6-L-threonylcarbamoyladenine synthase
MKIYGTTIDDACGEAFDKVAKYYDLGFPGGVAIDRLARKGDPRAFRFPDAHLHKGEHPYDLSYSGLKTAVINQLDQFWNSAYEKSMANIAASFQKSAIDQLLKRVFRAARDTGLTRIVAGGGVAANSYLRESLVSRSGVEAVYPSLELCTDNGAMVAGLGYHLLQSGQHDGLDLDASARVPGFRRTYP